MFGYPLSVLYVETYLVQPDKVIALSHPGNTLILAMYITHYILAINIDYILGIFIECLFFANSFNHFYNTLTQFCHSLVLVYLNEYTFFYTVQISVMI